MFLCLDWPNVMLILGHRHRRFSSIKLALGQCLIPGRHLLGSEVHLGWILYWLKLPSKHDTSTQCKSNAGPPSTTLVQHWTNIGLMYRVCWVGTVDRHSWSVYAVKDHNTLSLSQGEVGTGGGEKRGHQSVNRLY